MTTYLQIKLWTHNRHARLNCVHLALKHIDDVRKFTGQKKFLRDIAISKLKFKLLLRLLYSNMLRFSIELGDWCPRSYIFNTVVVSFWFKKRHILFNVTVLHLFAVLKFSQKNIAIKLNIKYFVFKMQTSWSCLYTHLQLYHWSLFRLKFPFYGSTLLLVR